MTAAALSNWRRDDRTSGAADLIPFSLGGVILGFFAVGAAVVIDTLILALAQYFSGAADSDTAWPQWAVALIGIAAIAVSLVVGRWLFGLRRWIGLKGDPLDHDTIARKRRHFAVGSMSVYLLLTPVVWFVMVALANTP